ncbi:MAG: O-antigen ligase family protein [Candidatus Limnocylindrales bacterium]
MREVLGVGERQALVVALGALGAVAATVAVSARTVGLETVAVLSVALLVVLVSVRWPLLPLFAFAAMIPIESVLVIGDLGTLSKFAGVLFVVVYGVPRLGRLALGAMPPAAWAYVAWALLSMGWAIDPSTSWSELSTLLQLFIIAVLVADVVAHRPTVVRQLLWIYSLSAAVTGLIGIEAFFTSGDVTGGRAAALQNQDPAQFAALLLPALVFSFYEVLNRRRIVLGALVALMSLAGIVVSGTRGAWLSVALVILLFILPRLRPSQLVAAVGVLGLLVIVTLQVPEVTGLIAQRADTALSSGGAGRTDIWSVAVKIYEESPVLGVGYANFPVAYTNDLVRATNVGAYSVNNPQGLGPHDILIGTVAELGPFGLLLLACFLVPLSLRPGWGPDGITVQACLVSLLTAALFLDILSNRKEVWLVIGLAAGLTYIAHRRPRWVLADEGGPATSPSGTEIVHGVSGSSVPRGKRHKLGPGS